MYHVLSSEQEYEDGQLALERFLNDIVEDAEYLAGEEQEYARDPYSYYGVKRSDVF